MTTGLIDSHAHLDAKPYAQDFPAVVARAKEAGVRGVVLVGQWHAPGDFGRALELAATDPQYFRATMGVHPHECANVPESDWATLATLARDPRVAAVGEAGLDYHYDHSPRKEQRRWFRHQALLAREVGKPLVVHTREADADTAEILAELPPPRGLIHCFTSDSQAVRRYLDLGLLISLAGVVTFKNADALREAAKLIPLDRLLVETDCPYLAPLPHRGKRNEPAFVALTAQALAKLYGVSDEAFAAATTRNAAGLFGFAP